MGAAPVVLLVDDDARVLSALRRALRREAYDLEVAGNAARALERLAIDPPIALVISDYKMPGMNGIELLTRVRSRHPETARILLSGWACEICASDREAAGLVALLAKPWDDGELKDSIRAALPLG